MLYYTTTIFHPTLHADYDAVQEHLYMCLLFLPNFENLMRDDATTTSVSLYILPYTTTHCIHDVLNIYGR